MPAARVADDLGARGQGHEPDESVGPRSTALDSAHREVVDELEFLTIPVSLGRIMLPADVS